MDCQTCKERNTQAEPIPYIAYESAMARMERANKRTWIALILAIVLLVGSNIAWVVYEAQFVDQESEVEVDTGDGNAYVAGIGDVTIGESKGADADANP